MRDHMISAVVTAAGKNRRMIEDLNLRGMEVNHKLLLKLDDKPVIIQTINKVLEADVDQCTVVLGHFCDEINSVLDDVEDKRLRIIKNPDPNVELSETLLNGVKNCESGLILCVAGDQPTVTTRTYKKLIDTTLNSSEPNNMVSVLARNNTGVLKSAEGLGMPFLCHSDLLLKYLPDHKDNLNPVLLEMIDDGVIFYGIPPVNQQELININTYQDYLDIKDIS
jgi:molybdenum cofactor cytidylyltransferase